MMNFKIVSDIPESMYSQLLLLIHDAFQEHLNMGDMFSCSFYTLADIERIIKSCTVFCCMENELPIGISAIELRLDEKGKKYAFEAVTAVSPDYKHKGVGTALYRARKTFLQSVGCSFLIADTSVHARDSIRWHINKCNCAIIGYASWPHTNYYSCLFREDFERVSWLTQKIGYRVKASISWIRIHVLRKADGSRTKFANFIVGILAS